MSRLCEQGTRPAQPGGQGQQLHGGHTPILTAVGCSAWQQYTVQFMAAVPLQHMAAVHASCGWCMLKRMVDGVSVAPSLMLLQVLPSR
jgi:hypothetical protein